MNINTNPRLPHMQSTEIAENTSPSSAQPKQQHKKVTAIALLAFGCLTIGYAIIQSIHHTFLKSQTSRFNHESRSPSPRVFDRPPTDKLSMVGGLARVESSLAPLPKSYLRSRAAVSAGSSSSSLTLNLADLTPSQGVSFYDSSINNVVSSAGDFNGDGFDDVIIGAPNANFDAGISYVIYGNQKQLSAIDLVNLTSSQGFPIRGNVVLGYSGHSVSGAGDFNGDEFDDVIIGAPYANNQAGTSYILFGTQSSGTLHLDNLTSLQGVSIFGQEGYSGSAVSDAGDFNSDGFADVIIGAPFANYDSGISYIIYGAANPSNIYLTGLLPGDGLYLVGAEGLSGISVSGAGDVNGDGFDDVIIGAPTANNDAGISYVIYGTFELLGVINFQNLGTNGFSIMGQEASNCGLSVSSVRNMTGGTNDDIIIASELFESYIIYGSRSGFVTPSPTAFPTLPPTAVPTPQAQSDDIWVAPNGEGFKAVYSAATFILSLVAGYFFREKIAFHILNHWGHRYKFMFEGDNTQLEEGEVGLRLDQGAVVCVVKGISYKLHTDDNDAGASSGLYDSLKRVLENPDISKSYALTPHEKNQLRDFLFYHNYIKTKKICCCLDSYPELGYLKGIIYGRILSSYAEHHRAISKKKVRSVSQAQISMQDLNKLSIVRQANETALETAQNPLVTDDMRASKSLGVNSQEAMTQLA